MAPLLRVPRPPVRGSFLIVVMVFLTGFPSSPCEDLAGAPCNVEASEPNASVVVALPGAASVSGQQAEDSSVLAAAPLRPAPQLADPSSVELIPPRAGISFFCGRLFHFRLWRVFSRLTLMVCVTLTSICLFCSGYLSSPLTLCVSRRPTCPWSLSAPPGSPLSVFSLLPLLVLLILVARFFSIVCAMSYVGLFCILLAISFVLTSS